MDSHQYVAMLEKVSAQRAKQFEKFRVKVPHGKSGPWRIEPFVVEMGIPYLRLARDGRDPGLGTFTKLVHERHGVVMSDTHAEINDFVKFLPHLDGRVLITGLGLGMAVQALLSKPTVTKITVIEKDPHVIELSGPTYEKDKRVQIICADALSWKPPKGAKYDCAWHDIWNEICGDNWPEMKRMRLHYRAFVAAGRQFCWGQHETEQNHKS